MMANFPYHTNDPDDGLYFLHYSNDAYLRRFTHPRLGGVVLFGDPDAPHDDGAYDDRLWQWYYEKMKEACDLYPTNGKPKPNSINNSAGRMSKVLSHVYGYAVEVTAIVGGNRPDNGYPWHYYMWRRIPNEAKETH